VVELADAGVRPASEIVDGAVEELVAAVEAVLDRLEPWDEPPPLALTGGLLDPDGPLRPRVARATERLDLRLVEEAVDPVRGAARLALEAATAG
jgi:N-acetylglucosamine kinase-like BadF-type ATPase